MTLMAKNTGGAQFAPAPAGSHAARCCWVIDLGTQTSQQYGRKHQVLIGWELPEEMIEEGDRKGEPYFISRRYTLSLHERSTLRKDLEAWRGKEFAEKELEGFDLRNILEKSCLLTVTHSTKDGRTSAKPSSVGPLPKSMKCPDRINELRVFDFDDPDQKVFEALPEWVQKVIGESDEMSGRKRSVPDADEPPPPDDDEMPLDDVPF